MIQSDLSISPNKLSRVSPRPGVSGAETQQANLRGKEKINVSDKRPDGWVKIDRSKFPLSNRQASASSLNAVAHSIRIADQAMEEIGKHIQKMKNELKTHVKNYPPYPPGSEERAKILKAFSAFRKLIDELTIPPDDNSAAKILNSPSASTSEKNGIAVEHDGFGKTIRSQPVGTGPEGLDIPEFPPNATDEEFETMISRLGKASGTLEVRRAGLQADAAGIFNPPVF